VIILGLGLILGLQLGERTLRINHIRQVQLLTSNCGFETFFEGRDALV